VENVVTHLTDRELDVLRLLAGQLSNKEIAGRLVSSTNTMRNHKANVFSKLQVENRLQAVERARSSGLLPSE
jgi:LuxR family maltose regulon positive regulatory protein